MQDEYKRPYTIIFNAVTDALAALDLGHYRQARELLVQAQKNAEETYISESESKAPNDDREARG